MKLGKSVTRKRLTAGLIQNPEIDQRAQAFAMSKLASHLGHFEKSFVDLYDEGRKWKHMTESLLKILLFYVNKSVNIKATNSQIKSHMVDITKIENLISEHECSPFHFQDTFQLLTAVYDDTKTWTNNLNEILSCNKPFTPSKCIGALENLRQQRPKG